MSHAATADSFAARFQRTCEQRFDKQSQLVRIDQPSNRICETRRVVHLELSSRGRALIERLERGRTEHLGKLITWMTPTEREALKTTLRAFAIRCCRGRRG